MTGIVAVAKWGGKRRLGNGGGRGRGGGGVGVTKKRAEKSGGIYDGGVHMDRGGFCMRTVRGALSGLTLEMRGDT